MLAELLDYASRRGLHAEPGFALGKEVHWSISFDAEGRFLGEVMRRGPRDEKGKVRGGQRVARAPEQDSGLLKVGQGHCHFLIEAAEVVALHLKPGETASAKSLQKHATFTRMLREAGQVLPPLSAIGEALDDPTVLTAIQRTLREQGAKPSDKVSVDVEGVLLADDPRWVPWWREQIAMVAANKKAKAGEGSDPMRCLATGELVDPAPTHPPIRGLAGANPTGALLVSFDKGAFRSFNLEQSANAAVGAASTVAYQAAIHELLRDRPGRYGDTTVLHWFSGEVPVEDDPLAWLQEVDSAESDESARERAAKLLMAIRTGQRQDLTRFRYYLLTLSGMSARVMVRGWSEGALAELVERVKSWFDDLAIVRPDGQALSADLRFGQLLYAIGQKRGAEIDAIPAPIANQLYGAAVQGTRIPAAVLSAAFLRERASILTGEDAGRTARMALIRAFHCRKNREQGGPSVSTHLDERYPDPAYHCGRLMAVLSDIQRRGLGGVNAGVVERFYGAASATPALVLGRLVRMSQHHLAKIDSEGLRRWNEGRIAGIMAAIDNIPRTLDLEQQSLFALGYYHQLAADRAPNPTTSTTDTNNEGA